MSTGGGAAPRLSVIIAAWNAEATIGAAIASVLDQRDVDLECIVVDDGSTDGTVAAVEGLAAADPRLVLVPLVANGGVSVARNRALDAARGAWIAFLDADDRLLPGGLGAMVRAGDAGRALVVVGQRISTDGERTWYPRLYDLPDIRQAGRKSVAGNPGLLYYAGPAGKLFAREVADGLRFEGRMLGDQPWVLRAMVRAGDRIVVLEDVVYEWRRPHPDRYVATITSARERSARLGTEAVRMAGVAFETVAAELDQAYDPVTAARLRGAYVARLLRADLAHQLRAAILRRDAALPGLLEALGDLAERLPAPAVAASRDAWRSTVVDSLAFGWHRIGDHREAVTLLRRVAAVDPGLLPGVRRPLRQPVGLVVRGSRGGAEVGGLALGLVSRLAGAWLRVRPRR